MLSRNERKIIAEAYAPHRLLENDAGGREQDPRWWIRACEIVMDQLVNDQRISRDLICAIGVSAQQHGMVPLDAEDRVIRPAKLWCDTETVNQCDTITDRIGNQKQVIDLIGNTVAAGFTASKILWLKENEPQNYEKLVSVLLPHDYLNFWLTGEKKTEYGDASGTAYFDVKNRAWSIPLLDAIDPSGRLQTCLPELIPSHMPVGTIQRQISDRFQLNPDILVSAGGGDNMMAAIGTGNVEAGIVTTSLGTSGTIYAFSDRPIIDPDGELAAFCSSSGGWLPLVCTMNVTVSTEQIRALLGLGLGEFNEKAAAAPLGAEGLLLLPYFNGERTPALPNGRAVLSGMTSANTTPPNLARAAMEGATLGLRYGLDVLRRLGIQPSETRLVGGGAKSPLWRKMVADLFDCPVICPQFPEAGAVGAAVQAMWCYLNQYEKITLKELTDCFVTLDESSRTEPEPWAIGLYDDIYHHYLELNRTMTPFFGKHLVVG